MAKAKLKPTPRKIKTLISEPNWKTLSKAVSEDARMSAWSECDDYVHYEVSDKEKTHAMRRWVETDSGWDLIAEAKMIPETFLNVYSKNAWKARRLGYMPQCVVKNLDTNLKPLITKAQILRERVVETACDFSHLDKDDDWHPEHVKMWLKKWQGYVSSIKSYSESPDSRMRMEYQTAVTYVYNLSLYLRSGVWLDSHWGENREKKVFTVSKVLAYDKNGEVKRTHGIYYPDLGVVWNRDMRI